MLPVAPSLPPKNLKSLLPTPATPWMVSAPVFQRLQADTNPAFRKCEILQTDPEWEFILQYFCAQKPANKSIARAYCIHNGAQHAQFEANISVTEEQTKNPHFSPKWKTESSSPLRQKTIQRWTELTEPYTPCTLPNKRQDPIVSTKIIPLWHGTKENICQSICSTGFATFGKHALIKGKTDSQSTDLGFFGSGIYFTTSANYAATIYSDGNLFLAWISMREPYPVVADAAYPQKPTDMQILEGLGAYQNYNAHYIPVVSIQPGDPNCAVYYPCTQAQAPVLDEIVVFNPSQALARFWIQLGPDLLKAPSLTTYNHLLEQMLELLDQETVQQNAQLAQVLEQKSELLLTVNLNGPLTPDDLTFYNCTLKLLDQTGKVRNIIHKQLQKIHAKQIPPPSPGIVLSLVQQPVYSPSSSMTYPPQPLFVPIISQSAPMALPACAFGKAKWATYFGDVGVEPPLPANILQIFQGPCPIWSGKTVEETHVLVLIPATVDGQPFTLKTLGEFIQKPKTGPATKYKRFNLGVYSDAPVNQSYWTLISQDLIEGSRNKNYAQQQTLVANLSQKIGIAYSVPNVLEAATGILMHQVSTGKRIYTDSPLTYTRCLERYNEEYQLVVGGFSSGGLNVISYDSVFVSVGVGVAWKL